MDVKEALLQRRSVRRFTPEAVSPEDVEALLRAAMSGPSACNRQPWFFCAVTRPEKLEELMAASRFTKIRAPLALVVCGDLTRALPEPHAEFWVQDCSAATENILLRAVELGLGAVWCGIYPQQAPQRAVRRMLELEDTLIPLNIIFIGHPAETPAPGDWYDPSRVRRVD